MGLGSTGASAEGRALAEREPEGRLLRRSVAAGGVAPWDRLPERALSVSAPCALHHANPRHGTAALACRIGGRTRRTGVCARGGSHARLVNPNTLLLYAQGATNRTAPHDCRFRLNSITESRRSRSPIPAEADHRIRAAPSGAELRGRNVM
jgi:hypothetical protein